MLPRTLFDASLGVPAFVAILFGIFPGCSFAQKAADNQDLIADELAVNASSRYAQGNYAEAAKLYRKFVADFGSALEAQAAVRQMRTTIRAMNRGFSLIFSVASCLFAISLRTGCRFNEKSAFLSYLPFGGIQLGAPSFRWIHFRHTWLRAATAGSLRGDQGAAAEATEDTLQRHSP